MMKYKVIGHSGALEDRRLKLIRVFSQTRLNLNSKISRTPRYIPDPGITPNDLNNFSVDNPLLQSAASKI